MKHLDIRDRSQRSTSGVFLFLPEILPALTDRSRASEWEVGDFVEADGKLFFETTSLGHDPVQEAAKRHARFSFADLEAMGKSVEQVIWASFKAFDPGASEPWLVLSAVDSFFWRVDTSDLPTRQAILARFKDVRIGEP